MGLPLLTCSTTRVPFSSSSSSSWCSDRSSRLYESPASSRSELRKRSGKRNSLSLEKSRAVKALSSGQSSGEVIDDGDTAAAAAARGLAVPSGDVTTVGSFSSGRLAGASGEVTSVGEFVGGSGGDWDKIGAVVRLSYGVGESTRWW